MKNNEYNLANVHITIYLLLILFFAFTPEILAEDFKKEAKTVNNTIEDEISWYAIIKTDRNKKKLYIKGDIFYSKIDTTKCLRIKDIKRNTIILEDINSKDIITVALGERIPLDRIEAIFERAVQTTDIKHENH